MAFAEASVLDLTHKADELIHIMEQFFTQLESSGENDFISVAKEIAHLKAEFGSLDVNRMSRERLPTAGAELEAITRDTEQATNSIMTSAEAIMALDITDPAAAKREIEGEVMRIFEACSFQDITGQRVSKIVTALTQIEQRISQFSQAWDGDEHAPVTLSEAELRRQRLLLNGPAINGPEVSQDDIDCLFVDQEPAAVA